MVGKENSADRSSSLARLRQFLAPHAPKSTEKVEPPQTDHEIDNKQTSAQPSEHDPLPVAPDDSPIGMAGSKAPEYNEQPTNEGNGMKPPQQTCDIYATSESRLSPEAIASTGSSNTVSDLRQLSHTSIEYARINHLLQCCLPGRQVSKVSVIDMRSPEFIVEYTRHANGLLEIDSWVSVNKLGTSVADLLQSGFNQLLERASTTKFTTGVFDSNNEEASNISGYDGMQQLILCKIAIGRSLVIYDEQEAQQALPPGYHSFHLLHRSCASSNNSLEFSHQYILPNTRRILPQYLVRFQVSKQCGVRLKNDGISSKNCGMCENIIAKLECKSCRAHLCENCDRHVHAANMISSQHTRTVISETRWIQQESQTEKTSDTISITKLIAEGLARSNSDTSNCSAHPDKCAEFFCPRCDEPVCVNCKVVGDHSAGEKGSHRLLTIAEAYEACFRETLRPDPLLESRRSVLDSKLSALQILANSVDSNKQRVREAIEAQYRRALQQLDENVDEKMNALNSEIYEYKRQSQQLDWVNASLERSRTLLGPIEFLNAWKQHKMLQIEQHEYPSLTSTTDFSSADQIKSDLELVGTLHVISTETASKNHTARRQHRYDVAGSETSYAQVELALERTSLPELDCSERVQPFASINAIQPSDPPSQSRPLSPTYHRVLDEATGVSPARASPTRPGSACPSPGGPLTPTRSGMLSLTPGKSTILAAPTPDKLATLRGMSLRRKSSSSSFNAT